MDRLYQHYHEVQFNQVKQLTEKDFENSVKVFAKQYAGILPTDKAAAILDVGCGAGSFLYFLKQQNYLNFWGIDISGSLIAYCHEHITLHATEGDAREILKNKAAAYDLIVMHDVLEHIPKKDVLVFLESIIQSLRPTGALVIRVPNMANPFSLVSRYKDFTHELGFTSESLQTVMHVIGLRQMRILPSDLQCQSGNIMQRLMNRLIHNKLRWLYRLQNFPVPGYLYRDLTMVGYKVAEKISF